MALGHRCFSGITLEDPDQTLMDKWWEKDFYTPPKPGSVFRRPMNPRKIAKGKITQTSIDSVFAGAQCTSISLYAVAWWQNIAKYGKIKAGDINHIIYAGHYLHVYLRNIRQVSKNKDLRVAIDDLPESCDIESGRIYISNNHVVYAKLDPKLDFGGMKDLREVLTSYATSPFGVIVTIAEYTQAVMYNRQRKWIVFDSHGHLTFHECQAKKASCWVFDDIGGLIAFLTDIRTVHDGYCQVARPFIVGSNCIAAPRSDTGLKRPAFSKSGRQSSSCPGKIEFSCDPGEEDDSYVSFMGGFGG